LDFVSHWLSLCGVGTRAVRNRTQPYQPKTATADLMMMNAARRLETGRGDTRLGAKGLRDPAVRTFETEAAIAFAKRVATSMPPIRLTDLVADIDRMTGFSSLFEHLQTARSPSDLWVFFAALIAEPPISAFRRWTLPAPSRGTSSSRWLSGTLEKRPWSGRKPRCRAPRTCLQHGAG
jgi:hypothetical protein